MLKPTRTAVKTIDLGGKTATITVTHYTGKVRRRDPVTFKNLGWKQVNRVGAKCDLYPNAEWYPYVDFGEKTISGSFDGWELREPEFPEIENAVKDLLFEAVGWK